MRQSIQRSYPLLLAGLLLFSACATRTKFMRVVAADGRVYYADKDRYMISESGGFIMFKDLITREPVRLKNGSYVAIACHPSEIGEQQAKYYRDPSKLPHVDDLPKDDR